MARLPQLESFAAQHNLKMITVISLSHPQGDARASRCRNGSADGLRSGSAIAYENVINGDVHLAMVMGDVKTDDPVLVRVHTENVTCDMFGSLIDDTGFFTWRSKEVAARRWFFTCANASTVWIWSTSCVRSECRRSCDKREASLEAGAELIATTG